MRGMVVAAVVLLVVFFVVTGALYPTMPYKLVTHWDAAGEPNGHMFRFWGLFLLPIITLGIVLLFFLIPHIEPFKKNINTFRNFYDGFIAMFILFMMAMQTQLILWNKGIQESMNVVMAIGIGILFFYIGVLLKHTKRNWFIGIRTPWTLSSDKVWKETHDLGGIMFMICGVVSIVGAFYGEHAFWFILLPVVLAAVISVVYSYILYRKEEKKGKR